MDISYLLFLQNFRLSIHDAWTPFLEGVSLFAVTYLILLPTFVYWCVNKRSGLFTLCATYLALAVNAVTKLSVCAYRPWIRDARILPAGDAIKTATGYSFPSGHTACATPIYGGLAVTFWEKKITRWISVLCVLAILVTGFSRNYFGVHTPQDVGVALIISILALLTAAWIQRHPEYENKFLLGGCVFCTLAFLYITFKPYPMDYVNGKLLVNPAKMMKDGYGDVAVLAAFCVARYIEKRWINFKETGFTVKGVFLSLIGLVPLYVMITYMRKPLTACLGDYLGRACSDATIVMYIVALYPLVIKWFTKPEK